MLKVPVKLSEMLLVVSVTVTSVNSTVIGGLHGGWNVAVSVRLKMALPFWTGKSPAAGDAFLVHGLRVMAAAVDAPALWR